jgi:hypothetical protein
VTIVMIPSLIAEQLTGQVVVVVEPVEVGHLGAKILPHITPATVVPAGAVAAGTAVVVGAVVVGAVVVVVGVVVGGCRQRANSLAAVEVAVGVAAVTAQILQTSCPGASVA